MSQLLAKRPFHLLPRAFTTGVLLSLSSTTTTRAMTTTSSTNRLYGLAPGIFSVGVTTTQFTDPQRKDPGDATKNRSLQTEIWYPAQAVADTTPRNKFSDFLGLPTNQKARAEALTIANGPTAFGGYREGLTIKELDDSVWKNEAVRDAKPLPDGNFPLVLFSHGSGAYRASYIYWCEFLASHGYVVAAPDHPGSARFTIVDGQVITPDEGVRSDRSCMERERPLDLATVLDGMQQLALTDSRFRGLVDCNNVAVTGMSFGGYTTAAFLEYLDPRVKAAVLQCPNIAGSGTKRLHFERNNKQTPVMVMLGTEDTVIGEKGNQAGREYVDNHEGPAYLLEIVRGGHVSFTSCEIYDPNYGNGIGATKECPSLTNPGETYKPLDIVQQHCMINSYGLAFLNAYLKESANDRNYLEENHFAASGELIYRGKSN